MHQRCFVANGAVAMSTKGTMLKCLLMVLMQCLPECNVYQRCYVKCLLMCYVALSANGDIALTVNDAMLLC